MKTLKDYTRKQQNLIKKHGTPKEFEAAVWNALGEISFGEAECAIAKYKKEFKIAGKSPNKII